MKIKDIRIDSPGSAISESDISDLESNVGFALPSDYCQFLRKHNGGQPMPYSVEIVDFDQSPTDVQVFFGINRIENTSNISWNLAELSERLNGVGLPIACDSGGALFVLKSNESVVYLLPFEDDSTMYFVADSFSEFVNMLS